MKLSASDFWSPVGGVIAIVGIPLTIFGLWLGYRAYTRQFGYDRAEIRLVRAEFSAPRIEQSLKKSSIFGDEMIGLSNLDDMILWNPAVVIETLSNAPLESLRLEVTPLEGFIDTTKDFSEADRKMTPWVLEGAMTREYPITTRPEKGQKIVVSVADLLVRHMAQAQVKEPERRHRAHYGKYLVQIHAKLAGSPTWSEEIDGKGIAFKYFWYPTGFPEKECEAFAKAFSQPLRITHR